MILWRFLQSRTDVPLTRVIAVAALSGLSNAVLLAVINIGAGQISRGGATPRIYLIFSTVITIYVLTQRYVLRVASIEVEKIVARTRVTLAAKIRQSDLHSLETLGRSRLYTGMHTDTITISQATTPLILACQGAVLVMFSLLYILILSRPAFFLTVTIVGMGIFINITGRKGVMVELGRVSQRETEFFDALTHLIDGFKEIKLNDERSSELFQNLKGIAAGIVRLKSAVAVRNADFYIFTQVAFYTLIGTMIFILPSLTNTYPELGIVTSEQVMRITAAILFIIGPLTLVVSVLPVVRNADHAVANLVRLQADLERSAVIVRPIEAGRGATLAAFDTIELENVEFRYLDREGKLLFPLGPLNLRIRSGEILLIRGGNGSGKSTLLKLLTGLYYPLSGNLYVDGVDVRTVGYQAYRSLFSAIFSDYHLFDRLYGISAVEGGRVQDLLIQMGLDKKTRWQDGRFENQELSTGQKKRLALITSLLEDRPVYVFDEWAADQDPEFRQYFYESLLPDLQRRGKTIIAATHDDRYYHVGDRIIEMYSGKFAGNGSEATSHA